MMGESNGIERGTHYLHVPRAEGKLSHAGPHGEIQGLVIGTDRENSWATFLLCFLWDGMVRSSRCAELALEVSTMSVTRGYRVILVKDPCGLGMIGQEGGGGQLVSCVRGLVQEGCLLSL